MSDANRKPDYDKENVVAFRPKKDTVRSSPGDGSSDDDRARIRGNIAALVLAAVLVFAGWLLVQKLGQSSRTGDCLMSGRTNCAPIETSQ